MKSIVLVKEKTKETILSGGFRYFSLFYNFIIFKRNGTGVIVILL